MTKYAMFYENENNEIMFVGSFIGKNHHKIKFVMYRYLKTILGTSKPIVFSVYGVRKRTNIVYVGSSEKMQIETINEIKSINNVVKASKEVSCVFKDKISNQIRKNGEIAYTHTHAYRETYNDDSITVSESDSEFDSNEYE